MTVEWLNKTPVRHIRFSGQVVLCSRTRDNGEIDQSFQRFISWTHHPAANCDKCVLLAGLIVANGFETPELHRPLFKREVLDKMFAQLDALLAQFTEPA